MRDHIRNWRFLERVRAQRDIVSIYVKYEEGLEETYYLPWTSLDFTDTSNALQQMLRHHLKEQGLEAVWLEMPQQKLTLGALYDREIPKKAAWQLEQWRL